MKWTVPGILKGRSEHGAVEVWDGVMSILPCLFPSSIPSLRLRAYIGSVCCQETY
jgi:hypothetical protein